MDNEINKKEEISISDCEGKRLLKSFLSKDHEEIILIFEDSFTILGINFHCGDDPDVSIVRSYLHKGYQFNKSILVNNGIMTEERYDAHVADRDGVDKRHRKEQFIELRKEFG